MDQTKLKNSLSKEVKCGLLSVTHLRRVARVECRMTQHWYSGAKMDASSWKALPNPRPWSMCNGAELLPNI